MSVMSQQRVLAGPAERRRTLRRALLRMPPVIVVCFALLFVMVAAAVLAPYVAPYHPDAQKLLTRLKPPLFLEGGVAGHLLGTDQLGRDVLSRILHALRASLGIAVVGMVIGLVVGTAIGLVSGLLRGWTDNVIMMLVDSQVAIPFVLVALAVIAIFGTGTVVLVAVIGFAGWETYARLVRGQVMATRELPFVEASTALGASNWRIAVKHILPNIASPVIVLATLNFSSIVLLESALSFLGLGVKPPTATLGSMVGAGRDYMATAWWMAAVPSFFIVLVTMVVSLIGDWLRDTLDTSLDR